MAATATERVIHVPTFDAEAHRYTYEGRVLPSVTQVLHDAGMVDTRWFTDEARQRGTEVHAAIAAEADIDDLPEEWRPYLWAYIKFRGDWRMEVEHQEQPLCDPVAGYAGTLDLIVRDGMKRILIDVKTGTVPPSVGAQTAAYHRVARSWYPAGVNLVRASLHLRSDATYRFDVLDSRSDEQDFLSALRVHQFRSRYGLASTSH